MHLLIKINSRVLWQNSSNNFTEWQSSLQQKKFPFFFEGGGGDYICGRERKTMQQQKDLHMF